MARPVNELVYRTDDLEVAVLPELGARLHRLVAFGHSVLRSPDEPGAYARDPFFWGGYLMAPWCNRLAAGPIRFGSRVVNLVSNFADGTAIHGQVYARPWEPDGDGRLRVTAGGDGWPWRYEAAERIEVSGAELRLELSLTNLDDDPMPAGIGIHPWFRKPLEVAIHADLVIADNVSGVGAPRPVDGNLDLRTLGPMAEGVDATWCSPSDPAVQLVWPGRVRATMRLIAPQPFVVAANLAGVDALAVEAQTHAPQGLRRLINGEAGGLAALGPGETLSLRVHIAFQPLG